MKLSQVIAPLGFAAATALSQTAEAQQARLVYVFNFGTHYPAFVCDSQISSLSITRNLRTMCSSANAAGYAFRAVTNPYKLTSGHIASPQQIYCTSKGQGDGSAQMDFSKIVFHPGEPIDCMLIRHHIAPR